jgi:AsmA protein
LNVNAMNINPFKPLIENKLTAMLGRQVKLGDLSVSPLSSTVDAQNLTIADDPQFSSEPFITAAVIHIGVQMRPLLLQRQILIESLEIEAPQIRLVRTANGAWNVFTLARNPPSPTQPQTQQSIPDFSINSFRIKNGNATLENLPSPPAPFLIGQLDLAIDNFALAKEFPATLSAVLSGQSKLNITGNAGPIDPQNLDKANLNLKLACDNLPIDDLQSLLSAVGIKLPNGYVLQNGTITTNLAVAGPLQALVINGAVEFANIRLSGFKLSSQ